MTNPEPETLTEITKRVFFTITTTILAAMVGVVFWLNPPTSTLQNCTVSGIEQSNAHVSVETSCGNYKLDAKNKNKIEPDKIYTLQVQGWFPPQTIIEARELSELAQKLY